ncbi:hypothetical protein [Vibrio vulnificus]|uniref:hypothetical protein n=1 Tax=Vibrio vulnificus TaxID=672 RepID=UPI001A2D2D0F|nr:hypothetical protein [Vibrio vulnificus]HDY7429232.1 hypothetical protein [Vibrio vulnificus]HDY7489006.1 hypothetical protein [Vibrio vulnificus]HDY7951745.1 hypothetical protein [Vibrio vulnificus]HDY8192389.1 hypothetical protein [Vibrio vulnificus]
MSRSCWVVGPVSQPSRWDIENGFIHAAYCSGVERGSFNSKSSAQEFCDRKNSNLDVRNWQPTQAHGEKQMLVITSESEYNEVEQNLISFCEHPLYGECPEHEQESQEMLDALNKWREDNPR